ncbi:UNVERIFIED_CONTAM: hypothetical protein GTU68_036340 [Idotea baltica]|nr:hypothetical protein [Idotea baltica]
MDSQVLVDGSLLEIVDAAWRTDVLPSEEIAVPVIELPDPEPDAATQNLTLKQLENKWADLMLGNLLELQSLNSSS